MTVTEAAIVARGVNDTTVAAIVARASITCTEVGHSSTKQGARSALIGFFKENLNLPPTAV